MKKSRGKTSHHVSVQKNAAPQSSSPDKLKIAIRKIDPARLILGILVFVYFCLTFSHLYQRYIYLEMKEPTDSGAYIQTAWSVLCGSPYTVTMQEDSAPADIPHNTLGVQLYFILALFAPIYLFTKSGVPFLVIQAVTVSLAAIPLYLLGERMLKDKWLSLLITAAYFFNPATYESFEKFGFRLETLFIPCLFTMFYFLEKDKYLEAGISLMLGMITKHNMIMISFMLGLYYLIFDRKRWRFGVFCTAAAIGYYIIGVELILNRFQVLKDASFRHFAAFGETPFTALVNMVSNPGNILDAISPMEWRYSNRIFSPAGFLALLHPIFWVCLPQLVMNAILTDYHSVYCAWHWAMVVPFIFVGIISTIKWVLHRFNQIPHLKYAFFAILTISLYYNLNDYNKTVLNADKTFFYKKNNIDTEEIINRLSIIEADAPVMVSGQLLWFFAARDHVYCARMKFHDEVKYVAILLPIGQRNYHNLDRYLLIEARKPNSGHLKKFKVVSRSPNLVILKNIHYKG